MAIYAPGKRDQHNRPLRSRKRSIVALLTLTAMVDMFTVLTIFLLQNYRTTGEVLYLPKEVHLPNAKAVKELAPAYVVTIGNSEILVDRTVVAQTAQIKEQEPWMIDRLFLTLKDGFAKQEAEEQAQNQSVSNLIRTANNPGEARSRGKKVTVQADKEIDFLTVKKVMFTVTEAGASEINFAVIKDETAQGSPAN